MGLRRLRPLARTPVRTPGSVLLGWLMGRRGVGAMVEVSVLDFTAIPSPSCLHVIYGRSSHASPFVTPPITWRDCLLKPELVDAILHVYARVSEHTLQGHSKGKETEWTEDRPTPHALPSLLSSSHITPPYTHVYTKKNRSAPTQRRRNGRTCYGSSSPNWRLCRWVGSSAVRCCGRWTTVHPVSRDTHAVTILSVSVSPNQHIHMHTQSS